MTVLDIQCDIPVLREDGSFQIWRFDCDERAERLTGLPGDISGREPPDPIPNSEVKTSSADGSVVYSMRE